MRTYDKKQNILEANLRLEGEFINRNGELINKKVPLTNEEKVSVTEMVLKSKPISGSNELWLITALLLMT